MSDRQNRGLGFAYFHSMQKYASRVAQIDGETEETQTFGTLLERCTRVAIAMKERGLKSGDFISLCTFNHFDECVPYIAGLFIGVITASVHPTMSAREIVYLLNQVSPKIIFVSEESVPLIVEVRKELGTDPIVVVFGDSREFAAFSELVKPSAVEKEFQPREPDDLNETALVAFSSGTTGSHKGICHSHETMLADQISATMKCVDITISAFTPSNWITFHMFLHLSVMCGFSRLVFPSFDYNNPWKMFNFKIDFAYFNPKQIMSLLKHEKPKHVNEGNILMLSIGSYHFSEERVVEVKSRFPTTVVRHGYGLTEIFGRTFEFLANPKGNELSEKYPNSVGLPCEDVAVKIVDIKNEAVLGPNQRGELRFKVGWQAKGYHNMDSSDMFDSEGWLRTGDLAYYNEENCFFIVDRIKESFKYQSHHIIPAEIEDVLLSHPAIFSAVIVGRPHETDDSHVMAVVTLKEGKNVSVEEIIKYVDERVEDKYRLRGGLKIVSEIPFTVTNKINRFKLRQMIINNEL